MRVLVTRTREDARRTADELAKRGHEAIIAPLSEIRLLNEDAPDLEGVQAIFATSGNGVRAFADRCDRRDIRVLAVGDNTAAVARSAGFFDVASADGDSAALCALIRRSLSPGAGVLLHATGRSRGGELRRELAEAGFECRVWELYEVVASRTLPKETVEMLRAGTIEAMLVLSPESGRILVRALKTDRVAAACNRALACCISEPAAAAIRGVEWGAIRIAETPTLDRVLALLDFAPAAASTARG